MSSHGIAVLVSARHSVPRISEPLKLLQIVSKPQSAGRQYAQVRLFLVCLVPFVRALLLVAFVSSKRRGVLPWYFVQGEPLILPLCGWTSTGSVLAEPFGQSPDSRGGAAESLPTVRMLTMCRDCRCKSSLIAGALLTDAGRVIFLLQGALVLIRSWLSQRTLCKRLR